MRLADLLAGLSRLADLGFGIPAGEALRSAALAALLGRSLDVPDEDLRAAIYTAMLHHVGCTGYAHEAGQAVGDELTMYAVTARTNLADPKEVFTTFLPGMLAGRPLSERLRLTAVTLAKGRRIGVESTTAACEVGRDAARRLGLSTEIQHSLYRSYEWWNGKGVPDGIEGDAIPLGARLAAVSSTASLLDTTADRARVAEVVRSGSGALFDPELAHHLDVHLDELLDELAAQDPHELVLEAEPHPVAQVRDEQLVEVATVFGDLADLKTPHLHGHSRGVARLARGAGAHLAIDGQDLEDLEVAALLHDVGRVAISAAVWDKPGELTRHEWEQVRLHAYHSERILAGSERLAHLASLVGMHHERCDGSGYHRGCQRGELPLAARVLAAADAYQAMTQSRPHREAFAPEEAEERLRGGVHAGWLDEEAASAVLAAAGHPVEVRRDRPAGLTDREVEVLGLIAAGCANRQIAEKLVISRRTAEHHVQHIYAKIGASSRAAAALFAMEHDLIA
jgi:HD-GYP domain-containing protein (c-di-GMP phosphodiesterase class II)/DNA-binding CsgD family transcriptional regulator